MGKQAREEETKLGGMGHHDYAETHGWSWFSRLRDFQPGLIGTIDMEDTDR